MIYSDDHGDARRIAEDALSEMADAAVPATPPNYAVWYDHLSGRNPELSQTIEQIRADSPALTPEQNRQIYERFCLAGNQDVVPDSAERIESVAGRIAQALNDVGASTAKYGAALANATGSLDSASGAAEIAAVIKDVLSETRLMDDRVRDLQEKVRQSHEEVTALRDELEESRREAMTDVLTGLDNRRSFDSKLEHALEAARAAGRPMCLVLADIDHFKQLNDSYGHQFGDQVLRLIGRMLRQIIKSEDIAARYGGEEFALVLTDTDIRAARVMAEDFRQTLASRKLAKKGSNETLSAITMSFGVTEHVFGEAVETFVARADAHLYHAKNKGRNRVSAGLNVPQSRKAG